MRVCLTNPCWRDAGRRGIRAGCRVPNLVGKGEHTFLPFPFTLAYAASVLEANGVDVMVLDAIAEDIDAAEYFRRVEGFQPDLVVNEMSAASYDTDLAVAHDLRRRTKAKVALCGPHPSAIPAEVLADEAVDYVLLGEYEDTLRDLVEVLEDGAPTDAIPGLALRTSSGVVVNARRQLRQDLDSLPYPHRQTLPMHSYRVAGYPSPVLYVYSSRGCPYRCNYCLWPQTMYGVGNYRVRRPEAVVDEIRWADERHGPFASVYFDDDTFNLGRQHMMAFAEALRDRPRRLPWGCNARADRFDPDCMRQLAAAGLSNIRIGIESGDPQIGRRCGKSLDLEAVRRCITMAHDNGVMVHVTFMVGLPGESWESIKRTAAFARSITPDSAAFTIATPFPGTAYYDEVSRDGLLLSRRWRDYNVVDRSVVRTEQLSGAEVESGKRYLMRAVYSSPTFVLRRLKYAASVRELVSLAKKAGRLLRGRL